MTARATRWLLLMMIMTLIRKLLLLLTLILLVLLLKLLEGSSELTGIRGFTNIGRVFSQFWYLY